MNDEGSIRCGESHQHQRAPLGLLVGTCKEERDLEAGGERRQKGWKVV